MLIEMIVITLDMIDENTTLIFLVGQKLNHIFFGILWNWNDGCVCVLIT